MLKRSQFKTFVRHGAEETLALTLICRVMNDLKLIGKFLYNKAPAGVATCTGEGERWSSLVNNETIIRRWYIHMKIDFKMIYIATFHFLFIIIL